MNLGRSAPRAALAADEKFEANEKELALPKNAA